MIFPTILLGNKIQLWNFLHLNSIDSRFKLNIANIFVMLNKTFLKSFYKLACEYHTPEEQ